MERNSPLNLLSELNEIGGRHEIGRVDMVESRLVGMKSRGLQNSWWDHPLHGCTQTRFTNTWSWNHSSKRLLPQVCRAGGPLRESMDAFMEKIPATTTGSVSLKLYKGSVTVTRRESPHSLYRQDISSFERGQIYDETDATGFSRLYGLPMRVRSMLESWDGLFSRLIHASYVSGLWSRLITVLGWFCILLLPFLSY